MSFQKRPRESIGSAGPMQKRPATTPSDNPIVRMFEGFKEELDAHQDRRERVVKASRDITAASKKIIFSLQRSSNYGTLKPSIKKEVDTYLGVIKSRYNEVAPDLQGPNAARYSSTITHGNQEFVEALSFLHYIKTQTLISHEEADRQLKEFVSPRSGVDEETRQNNSTESGADITTTTIAEGTSTGSTVQQPHNNAHLLDDLQLALPYDDYLLGLFDLGGEIMRLAITTLGSNGGALLSSPTPIAQAATDGCAPTSRTVLDDLRAFRRLMEDVNFAHSSLGYHASKKMPVLQACVDKVELALYGLVVRGAEVPPERLQDMLRSTTVAVGVGGDQ